MPYWSGRCVCVCVSGKHNEKMRVLLRTKDAHTHPVLVFFPAVWESDIAVSRGGKLLATNANDASVPTSDGIGPSLHRAVV